MTGARSVLQRYADAWFQAANRRKAGQKDAGFPRRKRALVPVRYYHGTFKIDGLRVRLPVASGQPALWVRLARALRIRPSRFGRSSCWLSRPVVAGGHRRVPSGTMTWTRVGSLGWTLGSSTPMPW